MFTEHHYSLMSLDYSELTATLFYCRDTFSHKVTIRGFSHPDDNNHMELTLAVIALNDLVDFFNYTQVIDKSSETFDMPLSAVSFVCKNNDIYITINNNEQMVVPYKELESVVMHMAGELRGFA